MGKSKEKNDKKFSSLLIRYKEMILKVLVLLVLINWNQLYIIFKTKKLDKPDTQDTAAEVGMSS